MLIIFIDSLPYDDGYAAFSAFPQRKPLIPGLGYSVNVKSEMFGVGQPDQLGFFNEWNRKPKDSNRFLRGIAASLDRLEALWPFLRRIIRRTLITTSNVNIKNIPYKKLFQFSPFESNPYDEDYPFESIFKDHGFRLFTYRNCNGDKQAVNTALKAIAEDPHQNMFVGLADLDHIQHKYGQNTDEYQEELERNLGYVKNLLEALSNSPESIDVLICSDHGMSEVHTAIDPSEIISTVSASSPSAETFVDATMVRFWGIDYPFAQLSEICSAWPGSFLDATERENFGLTKADFGDYIFVLDVGYMFAPSDASSEACKAMHGYRPGHPTQYGIVALNFDSDPSEQIQALQLSNLLRDRLSENRT